MFDKIFNLVEENPRLTATLSYHGISDYTMVIENAKGLGNYTEVSNCQHSDLDFVLATSYANLAQWLIDNKGGY
ncbi:hypothetical protein ACOI22_03600 [Glaciecola sp. 2405UD65-10]|uniref:hypothetical protein n=1 Tax=Glaciecola sp. 2405UD65-10 TaxID=3397244 RepID=UPI003B5B6AEA